MANRTNLSQAFAELRKQGYFAKQNFMCCQSCGWAAMTEEESKQAVFYHSQDAADLRDGDDLYLAWNGDGHKIVSILEDFGLDVVWNEDKNDRIVVLNSSII